MKILLVEDEDPKRRHIEAFLRDAVAELELTVARSHNSAVDSLEESLPDLLILDMSLPTFDVRDQEGGGRPQGFGGTEVVRHMTLSGKSCPFVVITGYEAFPKGTGQVDLTVLQAELAQEFPSFVGIVHYNSAYDDWKKQLLRMIDDCSGAGA